MRYLKVDGRKMEPNTKYYTQQTIASWDEAASIHKEINTELFQQVQDPSFNHLNASFNTLVDQYGVGDKSVAQICCNNGIDLISIKNKGAARCVGIDGSAEFIKQAKEFSTLAGHDDMEFISSDVYDLPADYQNQFDIVFITVGVLYWMPDIKRFLSVCSDILKPGGYFLIEEIHPIVNMYEEGDTSALAYSYFNKTPCKDETGLDYFTNKTYKAKANYWFDHTLADILNGAIEANLELRYFNELPNNLGNVCGDLEAIECNPPLTMNMVFTK